MKTPGMIRVSFGIYNTEEEVDLFLEALNKVVKELRSNGQLPTTEVAGLYLPGGQRLTPPTFGY